MIPTLKEKIKQNILDADIKLKNSNEQVKEVSSPSVSTKTKNNDLLSGIKISSSLTKEESAFLTQEEELETRDEFSENLKQTFQDFIQRIVNAIIEFLQKINPFLRNKTIQRSKTKKELKDLEKKLPKK